MWIDDREVQHQMIGIELDIFSGEPNPTWTLSNEEAGELRSMFEESTPDAVPDELPTLGYRGFLVTNSEGTGSIPFTMVVFGGLITVGDEEQELRLDNGGIEEWLVDQARGRGFGDLIDEDRSLRERSQS